MFVLKRETFKKFVGEITISSFNENRSFLKNVQFFKNMNYFHFVIVSLGALPLVINNLNML